MIVLVCTSSSSALIFCHVLTLSLLQDHTAQEAHITQDMAPAVPRGTAERADHSNGLANGEHLQEASPAIDCHPATKGRHHMLMATPPMPSMFQSGQSVCECPSDCRMGSQEITSRMLRQQRMAT